MKKVTHLIDQFKPENYSLSLDIDKAAMTFKGTVVIRGAKVGRPTQRLTFHQKDLKVTSAEIIKHGKGDNETIEVDRINLQKSFDEVRLHSAKSLYPGTYSVTLDFTGTITKPMNGIYPCFFTEDEVEKQLIATQFESHHAREAFPCIDEPAAKAIFELTLTTETGITVLSNTPEKSQKQSKGRLVTSFEPTPKMSTYLLAFAYGELSVKISKTKSGTDVRVYAIKPHSDFTEFALEVGVKSLECYEEYFDIPYPLPKLDMIALPDFAAGAMENWGLVTYRESAMLYDPKNSSIDIRQHVALVVAHELAHQWFGNLVTMRWWTDLWLNEGFASWMEFITLNALFPEWNMWEQFYWDSQFQGLRLDALEHTHPIEVAINHPDEIRTIFDGISYSKGASVIHMLQAYLGAEPFRDGLRHYLKKHQYANTDTVDLWDSLSEVSGKDVKSFMNFWTSKPGYPIVTVEKKGNQLELTQNRFLLNPVAREKLQDTTVWQIPLSEGNMLAKRHGDIKADVLKINPLQTGFYRTTYSPELIKNLVDHMGELSSLDRTGLLSDQFEASKAGFASTTTVLELLNSYAAEDNPVVWDIIATLVGDSRRVMDNDEVREAFKPLIRRLTSIQLARLGWEEKKDEPYFDTILRPTILGMASGADEEAVVAEALRFFNTAKKPEDIAPNIRGIVYGTAARKGGKAEFDKLWNWHETTTMSDEKLTLTAAMTEFEQPELIDVAIAKIRSDSVRHQDVIFWIMYLMSNRYAKRKIWDWVKENWQWLDETFAGDLSQSRMPMMVARSFSSPEFLEEFTKFFEDKKTPTYERTINQGLETLGWQIAWKARDEAAILAYLKK